MRLTIKLVLVFILANIVLAVIYGYLAIDREVRMFEQTATAEAETLGRAMENQLADAWCCTGQKGVEQFVRKVNDGQGRNVRIRWVWFDTQPGSEFSPSVPLEYLTMITIQQPMAVESFDSSGTPYLHVYWPVTLNIERQCGLEFSHPMTELDRNKREIIHRTALLIGGMVALSALLAVALGVRFVGRPLRQIIEKTRRVAVGDLEGPIHLHSRDELAELADSLNAMCAELAGSQRKIREESAARITALEQLRHADRLQTVGRLASGIAHELGTPLNVVSGRAGLIASGKISPEEIGQSAAAIKAEADKMTKIIRGLLDFARSGTPHRAPADLRQVVSQTVALLRPTAEKDNVQLRIAPRDDPAIAEVDANRIQQVLTNLLVNAIQAMPEGGNVEYRHPPSNGHFP